MGFETIGYESRYPIENLGTLWFFTQIYLALIFTWAILNVIGRHSRSKCVAKARDKISGFVLWGSALRFTFQGYLELCLSILIGWFSMQWYG